MGFSSPINLLSVSIIFCCLLQLESGAGIDTITCCYSGLIKDNETISSKNGMFTLGFFSPENSTYHYLGIWFKTRSLVVWVANRNQPLRDSSGSLTISNDGNLVVLNAQEQAIWSSNVSQLQSKTSAQLQDSGNLVLLDAEGKHVWESFLHPGDTFLPGMTVTNKRTGEDTSSISWKSPSDPSFGNFTFFLERPKVPELFLCEGSRPHWRSGPWNGHVFTGILDMQSVYRIIGFSIVEEGDDSVQLTYSPANDDRLVVYRMTWDGLIKELIWDSNKSEWKVLLTAQRSDCDTYGLCGVYGSCDTQSTPICKCLKGFEPRNAGEWGRRNWTSGCTRRVALQCERDGFMELQKVKVPDFPEWSPVASEEGCRSQCLENCTCIAYAYDSGIGCMSWIGNLIDIQQFPRGGIDLHIRLANSEFDKERHVKKIFSAITGTVVGMVIIAACAHFLWKSFGRKRKDGTTWLSHGSKAAGRSKNDNMIEELSRVKFQEVLLFEAAKLAIATNNFDCSNKLGEGGFGPVYKGTLYNGQEIAVKKLSGSSGQGLEEFMNEVEVISKLQHRNLVKLLGCCIEGDDNMLIYEYMPNKSLDAFIFDPPEQKFIDWRKRFSIIEGIARGMLYLHRDSRLKIIHRDLKASNILLDEELNPKISDFGLARIFGGPGDPADTRTRRVVGTYGYMAPEYAMQGLFSEKSDVFSFGVLLLEIVSGRKNSSFYNSEQSLSFLGFTWKLWNEDEVASLIDPGTREPVHEKDILRCIQVGLLCVQESAKDRPTMSTVISMLNSEIVNLPSPRQPAFILRDNNNVWHQQEAFLEDSFSNNNVSITEIQGR